MRPRAPICRAVRLLAFCLLCLCLMVAQVQAVKSPRSTNTQRDAANPFTDLFCKEEVVMVTAGGHIQSPRYPNAYPRNLLLSWKLLAPPLTHIQLEFDKKFGLEDPEKNMCRYDFVEVEDLSESSTITWGRWCGRKPPSPITSKHNNIRITFKSDDFFVAKPGFRLLYSVLIDSPFTYFSNFATVSVILDDMQNSDAPLSADALDDVIAGFNTVEEILRDLNPQTWKEDINSIYTNKNQYRPRSSYRDPHRVDLDRLNNEVKQYSCTPRNYSVNLREELRATNAVFFPRCLLVKRCGGNCACGTDNWNSCSCSVAKTVSKVHEVLKFSPGKNFYRKRTRARWALEEIQLHHHEQCKCVCQSRPPR